MTTPAPEPREILTITALEMAAPSSDQIRSSKVERTEERIAAVIKKNDRLEYSIIALSVGLFIVGVALLVSAYVLREGALAGLGGFLQLTLIYPIRKLSQVRSQNIALMTAVTFGDLMTPAQAAKIYSKVLDSLLASGKL